MKGFAAWRCEPFFLFGSPGMAGKQGLAQALLCWRFQACGQGQSG